MRSAAAELEVIMLLIESDRHSPSIRVGGVIGAGEAQAFAEVLTRDVGLLAAPGEPIQLDFDDLELGDGSAVAEAVNALRALCRLAPLVVANAPQMLAHTLYKTNMLQPGQLRLETPRQEEGASN